MSCSFYQYRFRKYVSYSFPIISFCNAGLHYETPCILSFTAFQSHLATDALFENWILTREGHLDISIEKTVWSFFFLRLYEHADI